MSYFYIQCHFGVFYTVFMYTMSYGDGTDMYDDGESGTIDFFAYDVEQWLYSDILYDG